MLKTFTAAAAGDAVYRPRDYVASELPDYLMVVARPMALSDVTAKLERRPFAPTVCSSSRYEAVSDGFKAVVCVRRVAVLCVCWCVSFSVPVFVSRWCPHTVWARSV